MESFATNVVNDPTKVSIFFSHQWQAFGEPDPQNEQYEVMKAALGQIADLVQCTLENVLVWVDVFSIPQARFYRHVPP
eukprot:7386109-Prymnesium_polylepis.2